MCDMQKMPTREDASCDEDTDMNFATFSAVGNAGTHFVTTGGQLPVAKLQQNVNNGTGMSQVCVAMGDGGMQYVRALDGSVQAAPQLISLPIQLAGAKPGDPQPTVQIQVLSPSMLQAQQQPKYQMQIPIQGYQQGGAVLTVAYSPETNESGGLQLVGQGSLGEGLQVLAALPQEMQLVQQTQEKDHMQQNMHQVFITPNQQIIINAPDNKTLNNNTTSDNNNAGSMDIIIKEECDETNDDESSQGTEAGETMQWQLNQCHQQDLVKYLSTLPPQQTQALPVSLQQFLRLNPTDVKKSEPVDIEIEMDDVTDDNKKEEPVAEAVLSEGQRGGSNSKSLLHDTCPGEVPILYMPKTGTYLRFNCFKLLKSFLELAYPDRGTYNFIRFSNKSMSKSDHGTSSLCDTVRPPEENPQLTKSVEDQEPRPELDSGNDVIETITSLPESNSTVEFNSQPDFHQNSLIGKPPEVPQNLGSGTEKKQRRTKKRRKSVKESINETVSPEYRVKKRKKLYIKEPLKHGRATAVDISLKQSDNKTISKNNQHSTYGSNENEKHKRSRRRNKKINACLIIQNLEECHATNEEKLQTTHTQDKTVPKSNHDSTGGSNEKQSDRHCIVKNKKKSGHIKKILKQDRITEVEISRITRARTKTVPENNQDPTGGINKNEEHTAGYWLRNNNKKADEFKKPLKENRTVTVEVSHKTDTQADTVPENKRKSTFEINDNGKRIVIKISKKKQRQKTKNVITEHEMHSVSNKKNQNEIKEIPIKRRIKLFFVLSDEYREKLRKIRKRGKKLRKKQQKTNFVKENDELSSEAEEKRVVKKKIIKVCKKNYKSVKDQYVRLVNDTVDTPDETRTNEAYSSTKPLDTVNEIVSSSSHEQSLLEQNYIHKKHKVCKIIQEYTTVDKEITDTQNNSILMKNLETIENEKVTGTNNEQVLDSDSLQEKPLCIILENNCLHKKHETCKNIKHVKVAEEHVISNTEDKVVPANDQGIENENQNRFNEIYNTLIKPQEGTTLRLSAIEMYKILVEQAKKHDATNYNPVNSQPPEEYAALGYEKFNEQERKENSILRNRIIKIIYNQLIDLALRSKTGNCTSGIIHQDPPKDHASIDKQNELQDSILFENKAIELYNMLRNSINHDTVNYNPTHKMIPQNPLKDDAAMDYHIISEKEKLQENTTNDSSEMHGSPINLCTEHNSKHCVTAPENTSQEQCAAVEYEDISDGESELEYSISMNRSCEILATPVNHTLDHNTGNYIAVTGDYEQIQEIKNIISRNRCNHVYSSLIDWNMEYNTENYISTYENIPQNKYAAVDYEQISAGEAELEYITPINRFSEIHDTSIYPTMVHSNINYVPTHNENYMENDSQHSYLKTRNEDYNKNDMGNYNPTQLCQTQKNIHFENDIAHYIPQREHETLDNEITKIRENLEKMTLSNRFKETNNLTTKHVKKCIPISVIIPHNPPRAVHAVVDYQIVNEQEEKLQEEIHIKNCIPPVPMEHENDLQIENDTVNCVPAPVSKVQEVHMAEDNKSMQTQINRQENMILKNHLGDINNYLMEHSKERDFEKHIRAPVIISQKSLKVHAAVGYQILNEQEEQPQEEIHMKNCIPPVVVEHQNKLHIENDTIICASTPVSKVQEVHMTEDNKSMEIQENQQENMILRNHFNEIKNSKMNLAMEYDTKKDITPITKSMATRSQEEHAAIDYETIHTQGSLQDNIMRNRSTGEIYKILVDIAVGNDTENHITNPVFNQKELHVENVADDCIRSAVNKPLEGNVGVDFEIVISHGCQQGNVVYRNHSYNEISNFRPDLAMQHNTINCIQNPVNKQAKLTVAVKNKPIFIKKQNKVDIFTELSLKRTPASQCVNLNSNQDCHVVTRPSKSNTNKISESKSYNRENCEAVLIKKSVNNRPLKDNCRPDQIKENIFKTGEKFKETAEKARSAAIALSQPCKNTRKRRKIRKRSPPLIKEQTFVLPPSPLQSVAPPSSKKRLVIHVPVNNNRKRPRILKKLDSCDSPRLPSPPQPQFPPFLLPIPPEPAAIPPSTTPTSLSTSLPSVLQPSPTLSLNTNLSPNPTLPPNITTTANKSIKKSPLNKKQCFKTMLPLNPPLSPNPALSPKISTTTNKSVEKLPINKKQYFKTRLTQNPPLSPVTSHIANKSITPNKKQCFKTMLPPNPPLSPNTTLSPKISTTTNKSIEKLPLNKKQSFKTRLPRNPPLSPIISHTPNKSVTKLPLNKKQRFKTMLPQNPPLSPNPASSPKISTTTNKSIEKLPHNNKQYFKTRLPGNPPLSPVISHPANKSITKLLIYKKQYTDPMLRSNPASSSNPTISQNPGLSPETSPMSNKSIDKSQLHKKRNHRIFDIKILKLETCNCENDCQLKIGKEQQLQIYGTLRIQSKKKKKYKKKPPKPARPKPGQVVIATALDGSPIFCCPECQMAYPEKEQLEIHLIVHKIERRFICGICGAGLKRKEHLERHKLGHNPERPYVCGVCRKGFKRREHLNLHTVIHSGVKTEMCTECGKGFYRKDHLRKHTRSHESKRARDEAAGDSSPAPAQPASGNNNILPEITIHIPTSSNSQMPVQINIPQHVVSSLAAQNAPDAASAALDALLAQHS